MVDAGVGPAPIVPHVMVTKDLSRDEARWQTVADRANAAVAWSIAHRDDLGAFSPAFPTRLTVPEGVTHVRLIASVAFKFGGASPVLQVWSQMNGGSVDADGHLHAHLGYLSSVLPAGQFQSISPAINPSGPILTVRPGDYFELMVYQSGGGDSVFIKSRLSTYFSLEFFSGGRG